MTFKNQLILLFSLMLMYSSLNAQYRNFHTVDVQVDFDQPIASWDGFGVTYVQTAHTSDYGKYPQEYGGFSILNEAQKSEIIEMIFGENGLKPSIAKIFLDPLHLEKPGGDFDHELSTQYVLDFYQRGLKCTNNDGRELSMISTLYGPPAFMTKQKEMRGRDFDYAYTDELVRYCADWSSFLIDKQKLPLKYFSLHNEGEDWRRWPNDGIHTNFEHGHDYNLYWSPNMVADMMVKFRKGFDNYGLKEVGITPGETQNWFKFYFWGYADSIANTPEALAAMGLITSHGFNGFNYGRWYSGTNNMGSDLLKSRKPGLKSWVTSDSWGKMDVNFITNIWVQIYQCGINGFIPWAVIQRPTNWVNNDPNPGTAFIVDEDSTFRVTKGYYYYKQLSRAGQAGMQVAKIYTMDSEILPLGFSTTNNKNSDAFVLINTGITATYRADLLEIVNGKHSLQFSLTDPTKNDQYKKKNGLNIVRTTKGYFVEFAIDVKQLDKENFDLIAYDGENSIEGAVAWKKEGKLSFDKTNGDNFTFIPKIETYPDLDGSRDVLYDLFEKQVIKESRHTGTSSDFSANWSAVRTEEKVYFFVEITDPTNYQERRIQVTMNGTSYRKFAAFRTSKSEDYIYLGDFELDDKNCFIYNSPPATVTTFFGTK
ncbi:MAG: hypothetical protein JXA77_05865 [Bacteroidales bacterium]|nr:hypothetical protein [Bacteroidales bacterium]